MLSRGGYPDFGREGANNLYAYGESKGMGCLTHFAVGCIARLV